MNAGTPTGGPVQPWPSTVPWILPQVDGGVTCIVTSTDGTAYGVLLWMPICAV